MINTSLSLTNFRNHHHTDVQWGEHINIITGPNGAGKTNLIDAIHYLCMGRSFVSNSDQYVVRQGERLFRVKGGFRGNIRSEFEVACTYQRGEGKKLWVNDSPLERHADLIGRVPVVLVSPDDKKLTGEGPVERRSFMDSLISQTSPSYLDDLIQYRKIVKQRNKLLGDFAFQPDQLGMLLEPWDEQLVATGARIIVKRTSVTRQFHGYLEKAHEKLMGSNLRPSITYRTFCDTVAQEEKVREEYGRELRESTDKERERQQTVTGPHRDDFIFFLNDMELRKFGSQGQHRIFALALKMAQLYYYREALDDLPIFLLDDVFGDLDPHKTEVVMNMLLQHPGQSFLTAAHPDKISGFTYASEDRISEFDVQDGNIKVII